ncbi:MAG: serine/threonine protein phosphatase [Deltaproteobacteria bacterium]|nr:serine/threonine protein phosphatase [Deltaproteobacteria bacterium]
MAAPSVEPRPTKAAALWLLFLGPFFFVVYGFCDWYAASLPSVPAYFYEWEKWIPFVPAAIVPYFTIDILYAVSVFLCRDRRELNIHAWRIIAAILISAAGFILFPLRYAFERPVVDSFYGFFFSALFSIGEWYNQAPSLHMSLLIVLWACFARHTVGGWRWLLHGWCVVIGASVLLVQQHHFIDIWTGLLVGAVCLYVLPQAPRRWDKCQLSYDPQRRRLGCRYLGGSLACAFGAVLVGGWGWWLLWPAIALLLVALAYFGLGVAVFQKNAGQQSWPARILLAPYLVGAWISYRMYTRSLPAMHAVVPGVFFGRWPRADDLSGCSPGAVLDLTAEFSATRKGRAQSYQNVPILDLTTPEPSALRAAVEFIEKHAHTGPVYVHCALGLSRSATVVAAWLVCSRRAASADAALSQLAELRRGVTWSPAHVSAIAEAVKLA